MNKALRLAAITSLLLLSTGITAAGPERINCSRLDMLRHTENGQFAYLAAATTVNGKEVSEGAIYLARGDCKNLYATASDLVNWRFDIAAIPAILIEGEKYIPLNQLAHTTHGYDDKEALVKISAAPQAFVATIIDYDRQVRFQQNEVTNSAFVNYALYSREFETLTANAELGVSSNYGILRSAWTKNFEPDSPVTRLYSRYIYDFVDLESRMVLGDIEQLGSTRFFPTSSLSGIALHSENSINPNYYRGTVDNFELLLNRPGALQVLEQRRYIIDPNQPNAANVNPYPGHGVGPSLVIPEGPVEIRNYPLRQNIDYQLEAFQAQNQKQVLEKGSHYYPGALIREGEFDYSVAIGSPRVLARQQPYYSGLEMSSSARYGLSQSVTLLGGFATGRLSSNYAAGAEITTGPLGSLSLRYIHNDNHRQAFAGEKNYNYFASIGLRNVYPHIDYSLGLSKETGNITTPSFHSRRYEDGSIVRSLASIGLRPPGRGFGASVSDTHQWQNEKHISAAFSVSLNTSFWNKVPLQISWIHRYHPDHDDSVLISWSAPIGQVSRRFINNPQNRNAATQALDNLTLQSQHQIDDQYNYNGSSRITSRVVSSESRSRSTLSYRQNHNNRHANALTANYNNQWFDANINVVDIYQTGTTTASLSGALVLADANIFATNQIANSYALVDLTEGGAGLVVNGIKADSSGQLILPKLTPYTRNQVSLSRKYLPTRARVDQDSDIVVPKFGTSVHLSLPVILIRDAMVKILVDNGKGPEILPFDAEVTKAHDGEYVAVDDDSFAYVEHTRETLRLNIRAYAKNCQITLKLPKASNDLDADIPEMDPVVCTL